jgi:hypothetical protein
MNSEPGSAHPVAASVVRSIANGGVATGAAYELGLGPQQSGAVGAAVTVVSGAGEALAALGRRMHGSPGLKEQALRKIIFTYLLRLQEKLHQDAGAYRDPLYAGRIKGYIEEVGGYDDNLEATLISLCGALVVSSDFQNEQTRNGVDAALEDALTVASVDMKFDDIVREERGFWSRVIPMRFGRDA